MDQYQKLKHGLILTHIKGDIRQPYNFAARCIPRGYTKWSTAQSYTQEIDRILKELQIAISFLDKVPDDAFFSERGLFLEDYVMYHQGYFLALTHQLKDKIAHFIYAYVIADANFKARESESVKRIFRHVFKHQKIEKVPNLKTFLKVWHDGSEEDTSEPTDSITVALRKRTHHHHHKNPFISNEDFFQASSSRTLLEPHFASNLSDYGKAVIAEKGSKSAEAWRKDCLEKMIKTLDAIKVNIENISSSLFEYYKPPQHDERGKRIAAQWVSLMSSVDVKSCNRDLSVTTDFVRRFVEVFLKTLGAVDGVSVTAVYLHGSASRGDFMIGLSDINIVVILSGSDLIQRTALKRVLEHGFSIEQLRLDVAVFEQDDFVKNKQNEKLRFICNTDGTLVSGDDVLGGKPELRKSFDLVWLLNSDFKDHVAQVKADVNNADTFSQLDLELVARDLSKRAFRLGFGMVIGNNTVYSNRFLEMRLLVKRYAPENQPMTDLLYKHITSRLLVDKEGIDAIIEMCEEKMMPLYEAVREVSGKE